MKVNYFDLGLYMGSELAWMVDDILPSLKLFVDDYHAYGFEPCEAYFRFITL